MKIDASTFTAPFRVPTEKDLDIQCAAARKFRMVLVYDPTTRTMRRCKVRHDDARDRD